MIVKNAGEKKFCHNILLYIGFVAEFVPEITKRPITFFTSIKSEFFRKNM